MNITVVPSLPAASWEQLTALATALQGVSSDLQVDLVDGKFVPAVSWPYTEASPIEALDRLRLLCKDFSISVDCMLLQPELLLEQFVQVGVSRVIVHYGSTDAYEKITQHAAQHDYVLGLAFTNEKPVSDIERLLPDFDFIQVMGIAEVGKQGQPFDERTIPTVRYFRTNYPQLEIAVDGSVNKHTMVALVEAGATRLAPGSAISAQTDKKQAYIDLVALVS